MVIASHYGHVLDLLNRALVVTTTHPHPTRSRSMSEVGGRAGGMVAITWNQRNKSSHMQHLLNKIVQSIKSAKACLHPFQVM